MTAIIRRARAGLAALLCLLLAAGCGVPRGAGFEAEVLAAAQEPEGQGEDGLPAGFAVVPVTRETQAAIARWPYLGPRRYDWIRRQEQPASLIIAPGDTISVTVWDTEENSLLAGPGQRVAELRDTRVSSSGMVFLPFVGELRIAGMSESTARSRIEERYHESVPSAQVQLTVVPGRANTADLVGGVGTPGVYPLADRDVTLLSLIAQGGGVKETLANPQVRLFRGERVFGTSLARLYDDPRLDTTIVGGDRVIVEAEERYLLSLGAAGSEAVHVFPKDQVSALDALAIVGGVSDARADPSGILILREYPASAVRADGVAGPKAERVVFTLDLTTADGLFSARNFQVMSGDLVYATESPVTTLQTVLGLVGLARRVSN
jgi:polysaccharide export outer membrane protein